MRTSEEKHAAYAEFHEKARFWRARCACGWFGQMRTSAVRAHEDGAAHQQAKETEERSK